jgi:hypothetical protein
MDLIDFVQVFYGKKSRRNQGSTVLWKFCDKPDSGQWVKKKTGHIMQLIRDNKIECPFDNVTKCPTYMTFDKVVKFPK